MTDPNRDPDVTYDPADSEADPAASDRERVTGETPDAALDDASPDARNGAVGGTDGVTKNQDDSAQ